MKIFRVGFEYRVGGVSDWIDGFKQPLAKDAEEAIKMVRKDIMTFVWTDEPDHGKDAGKKIKRKTVGFRLISVECLATADM